MTANGEWKGGGDACLLLSPHHWTHRWSWTNVTKLENGKNSYWPRHSATKGHLYTIWLNHICPPEFTIFQSLYLYLYPVFLFCFNSLAENEMMMRPVTLQSFLISSSDNTCQRLTLRNDLYDDVWPQIWKRWIQEDSTLVVDALF